MSWSRTLLLVAAAGCAMAFVVLVGAGAAFLGHLLFDVAWRSLGLQSLLPVVFP